MYHLPTGAAFLPSTVLTENASQLHPSDFWVWVWPPTLQEVQTPTSSPARLQTPLGEVFHPQSAGTKNYDLGIS